MFPALAKISLLGGAILLLVSCTSVSYYGQSIAGHSRLMFARQPIDELIHKATPALRTQLELAQALREFAVSELSLPDNDSYKSYVALDRDFPV